jgi:uncharacterized membrane protein
MPFCVQCGNQVRDTDRFCKVCGNAQTPSAAGTTGAPPPPPGARASDPLAQLTPRNASLLCYIPMVGWVASIVVLASTRFRNDPEVRFNAFQGLYLFVAWLIIDWVVSPFLVMPFAFSDFGNRHFLPGLLKAAMFGVWIFMLVKVSQGESFRLPILGELAERSVSEQR